MKLCKPNVAHRSGECDISPDIAWKKNDSISGSVNRREKNARDAVLLCSSVIDSVQIALDFQSYFCKY